MENISMYKEILERLLSYPLKDQVKINLDIKEKIFSLSAPIFTAEERDLPSAVKQYVLSRQGKNFKPHQTSFILEGERKIVLQQKISFASGLDPASLRDYVHAYCVLAKHCRRTLMELAVEETYQKALQLPD